MDDIPAHALLRPFGEEARRWVLSDFFDGVTLRPEDSWRSVYELLLWIDSTIGLAHCYESDKSQPGRHWYPRTLAFHKWLANEFNLEPNELYQELDHLFRVCVKLLALKEAQHTKKKGERAKAQRLPYRGMNMPVPGSDPELEADVLSVLQKHYNGQITNDVARDIIDRVRTRLKRDNKRKNLLGEGFEDVVASIVERATVTKGTTVVHCRQPLSNLPGFREPAATEKERTVDLAIVNPTTNLRTLVTAKWSVRADREEQFGVDYQAYAHHEVSGQPFDYVWVTNEFDVARLVAACERRVMARKMFNYIVHVCPPALAVVHSDSKSKKLPALERYLQNGRIISMSDWLHRLASSEVRRE